MKQKFVKTPLTTVINITKIISIHYFEFDKNFNFEGESHDFWEIVYIDKGKVEIKCDEETKILSQGEVIFHRPNEFHSIKAYDSSPNFFVITFDCNSLAMSFFEKKHIALGKSLKPFIESIIKEAESAYNIPPNQTAFEKLVKKDTALIGSEQLIKTYLEQLLIMLIRLDTQKESTVFFPSKESLQHHLVQAIKDYVDENIEKNIMISDICRHIGYSKSYLSKVFHEQSGQTMTNYIIKRKISRAKVMIREGLYNFTEISEKLNFDTPQYFSRIFKKITNMTPSEFKKSLEI